MVLDNIYREKQKKIRGGGQTLEGRNSYHLFPKHFHKGTLAYKGEMCTSRMVGKRQWVIYKLKLVLDVGTLFQNIGILLKVY